VNQENFLAFANIGITIRRSCGDFLFFKVTGAMIPIETAIGLNKYGSPIVV